VCGQDGIVMVKMVRWGQICEGRTGVVMVVMVSWGNCVSAGRWL